MKRIYKHHLLIIVAALVSSFVMPSCARGQSIRERIQERREGRQENSDAGKNSMKAATVETIKVNGTARNYRLYLPTGYDPERKYPVVLSFHGLKANAERQESLSGFSKLADSEGFIAVYPDGLEAKWRFTKQNGDDVRFVEAIIKELAEKKSIDTRRIYANGISNGAQMVWRLVSDKPQMFAAVGLVAGGYPGLPEEPRPPAIIFHGTKDRILPYSGRAMLMPVREFSKNWAGDGASRVNGEIIHNRGEVKAERWKGRSQAILYTISGKGHSWPGSSMPARTTTKEIDASREMWNFFKLCSGVQSPRTINRTIEHR